MLMSVGSLLPLLRLFSYPLYIYTHLKITYCLLNKMAFNYSDLTLSSIYCITFSGTEKQHVADDYAKRLHIGQVECQELISDVVTGLASQKTKSQNKVLRFEFCENLNISVCNITESDNVSNEKRIRVHKTIIIVRLSAC